MQKETGETKTPDDYTERKLRALIYAVDKAYSKPFTMMWRSFLQGFMAALGATVGTTVFFTLLLSGFKVLSGVDPIKPTVEAVQNFVIPKEVRDKLEKAAKAETQEKPAQTPVQPAQD